MFSFRVAPYRKKDGTTTNMIIVTGDNVDSTKPYANDMKGFGAKWMPNIGTWGWFVSSDSEKMKTIINNMVKPAIAFLLAHETRNEGESPREVDNVINDLLNALDSEDTEEEINAYNNVYMSPKEIEDKIYSFKTKLVNCLSKDEFKKLMAPLIKFRRAMGYAYSFANTMLIWVQDPKATMVKSRKSWLEMNREVKPNAPAIAMYCPVGGAKLFKTKEDKERGKAEWLNSHNYNSERELTPGDKDRMTHYLNSTVGNTSWKLVPSFYDVRHTKQIEGTEDLIGSDVDVPWYNDSGKETKAVKEKIDALLNVVKESGIDVSKTKNLSGALGVSMGGRIQVLDQAKMNSNYLLTLCHEFAHELLHQTYLKDKDPKFAEFYYGKGEGKGFAEQQAELAAWLVCNFYGYDINESINYTAIWGMNEKNAVHAFNTVAKVSDSIVNWMNKKIIEFRNGKKMTESRNIFEEVHFTGLDVAKMLGPEAVKMYKRGVKQIEKENEEKSDITNQFNEMTNRINSIDKRNLTENYD